MCVLVSVFRGDVGGCAWVVAAVCEHAFLFGFATNAFLDCHDFNFNINSGSNKLKHVMLLVAYFTSFPHPHRVYLYIYSVATLCVFRLRKLSRKWTRWLLSVAVCAVSPQLLHFFFINSIFQLSFVSKYTSDFKLDETKGLFYSIKQYQFVIVSL